MDPAPYDPAVDQAAGAKLNGAYGPGAQAATGARILARRPDDQAQPQTMPVPVGDSAIRRDGPTGQAEAAAAGPYEAGGLSAKCWWAIVAAVAVYLLTRKA